MCPHNDDDGGPRLHSYSLNTAVIRVVRMQGACNQVSGIRCIESCIIRFIFNNGDAITLDVAMSLIERWWVPCQVYMSGIKGNSTGVTRSSTWS